MATLLTRGFQAVKAVVQKASRVSLSSYVVNAPHQYGQPYGASAGVADAYGAISPYRMREVALKTPTLAACINSILDYAVGVKLTVKNIDPSIPADPDEVSFVEGLLNDPNPDDTGLQMKQALFRDIVTLGYGGLEIESNGFGGVANLHVVDGVKFAADFDEHGKILGYNTINAHGQPVTDADGMHAWKPREILYFRRSAISNSKYPLAQLQQLFTVGLIEDLMLYFISQKFTDSNVPYGVFDLGEITDTELEKAIESWNAQVESDHRIMLTNTKNGGSFTNFGFHLKDLEAPQLLDMVRSMIMGILGVTKNELGDSQDINKSNGYYLSYTFKKRAVEPILNEVCATLTKFLLHETLGLKHLEVTYQEIDGRDELLRAQVDDIELKHGASTPNEVRARQGKPALDGGEDAYLFTGTNWVPMSMIRDLAQAQLDAVRGEAELLQLQIQQTRLTMAMQLAGMQAPTGADSEPQAGVTPPLIRAPRAMFSSTTPGGSGSSSFKISYPKPTTTNKPKEENPQKPTGGMKTLRQAGVRNDQ